MNRLRIAAYLLVALAPACGDSGDAAGAGGSGGEGDGKLHPKGNGVEIDESAACARLHDALAGGALERGCVATFRTCPSLVQSLTGDACHAYDDGSVEGCVAYYADATDCDDLKARADFCVPRTLGAPPAGCPE